MIGRRLTDFGGQNVGQRSGNSRKVAPENCMSVRCISCDKLHYVAVSEMARVSRTRCTYCGGGLTELEDSYYRRMGTTAANAKKQRKLEAEQKPYKCMHCDAAFRTEVALRLHTKEKHHDP